MRKNNDLGKYISDKLENSNQSPREDLWDKIELDLDKKKKRRALFLYFTLLTISIATTALFLNSDFNNSKVKETNPKITAPLNETNEATTNALVNKENDKETEYREINNRDSISKNNSKQLSTSKSIVSETEDYIIYKEVSVYKIYKEKKISVTKKTITTTLSNAASTTSAINGKSLVRNNTLKNNNNTAKNSLFSSTTSNNSNNDVIVKSNTNENNNNEVSNTSKNNIYSSDRNNLLQDNFDSQNNDSIYGKNERNKLWKTINSNTTEIDSITIDSITTSTKKEAEEIKKEKTIEKEVVKAPKIQFVSVFYGPTIYSSFTKGSSINSSFKKNDNAIVLNTSYGIIYRRMFENSRFRIGFSKTNLSYKTIVPSNNNQFITDYSNIELHPNFTKQSINATFKDNNKVELTQNLSYYEIPLELYKPLTKWKSKFGIDLILGITPQVFDKNNLVLTGSNNESFEIGKATNVRDVNIGIHIGLGVNYQITKNIQLDLNPIFKYQSIPYKDHHSFNPFYVAIQSGFSYKF